MKQVKFVDRTFNCKKSHAMAIWTYLAAHDNGVTNFHFELSADLLDEEMLDFLSTVRKGLFQFEIGIQSTNPKTIAAIDRGRICQTFFHHPADQRSRQYPPAFGFDRRPPLRRPGIL